MNIRNILFNRLSSRSRERSFVPAYMNDKIYIYGDTDLEHSKIELDQNLSLLLMQTSIALADDENCLHISYDDVYDLYYNDQGNVIQDFKFFNLPDLFNGFIKVSNSGNFLETDEVKYSFEFNDGLHPTIRRIRANIVTVDGDYKILPKELYECLKSIIEYNQDNIRNRNSAEQFQLLALIKDYAEKANLALNERLSIENKPIIIDKIKLDFEKKPDGLEIRPWIDSEDREFNDKFLSAFDRNDEIRSFYNVKDHAGNDIKVIIKNKEAAQKLKRNRLLTGDRERDFFRGINEVFEDAAFDLSLYGERVIGYGYLHYRANDSINTNSDESWFDLCSAEQYPCIMTNETSIRLHPEDLGYMQKKLVDMDVEQTNTTELELGSEEGISKLVLTKDELRSEILKIQRAICSPDQLKSKKALAELEEIVRKTPEKEYIEYNGRFVRNPGLDYIAECIEKLEHSEPAVRTRPKSLLIEDSLEQLNYEETVQETFSDFPLELPGALKAKLYTHQQAGVQRLQSLYNTSKKNGFLLADDMGLGKTIQILTFLAHLKELGELAPSLVVAPTILLNTWDNPNPDQPGEIQKFFESGTFTTFHIQGSIPEGGKRKAAIDTLQQTDLIFTTYDSLRLNHVWLGTIKWKVIVCDEIQYAKNPRTLVSNSLKAQNAEFKVACSATPIENSTEDLWNIMDFARPGIFGALADFKKQFVKPLGQAKNITIDERARINEELVSIIGPCFMRRSKEEQLKDLPPKRVIVDCILMNRYEVQKMQELNQLRSEGEPALPLIQKMVALCSHPRLLQDINLLNIDIEELINESSKLKYLQGILTDIQKKDEKAVVFTRFKNMQNILAKAIHHWCGIIPFIINGDLSAGKRSLFLNQYKNSQGFNVIILSPEAAGVGITVTEANHVIHYTRLWNPAKEAQATDRAYRIGQDKEVFVYYPISSYDVSFRKNFGSEAEYINCFLEQSTVEKSPEEKLNRLIVRKKMILNNFFLAAGDFEVDMIREWDEEDTNPNQLTISTVDMLRPDEFEVLCSLLFRQMGYTTYLTIQSGDYGVDVVIEKDGSLGLLQSKLLHQQLLSRDALNDVIGAKSVYSQIIGRQISRLIVMATADKLSDTVKRVAQVNNVEVVLKADLERMLNQHPIYYSQIQIENNDRYSLERLKRELGK